MSVCVFVCLGICVHACVCMCMFCVNLPFIANILELLMPPFAQQIKNIRYPKIDCKYTYEPDLPLRQRIVYNAGE